MFRLILKLSHVLRNLRPFTLTILFAVLCGLWIFGSDYLIYQIVEEQHFPLFQFIKGVLFILFCTLTIFLLSKRFVQYTQQMMKDDLRRTVQNLQSFVFKIKRNSLGQYIYTFSEGKVAEEFQKTTKDVYGKTTLETSGPARNSFLMPYYEKAFKGEVVNYEEEYATGRFLYTTLSPIIENGEVIEVVGSSVDITDRKRMEEELKHSEELLRKSDKLSAVGQLAAGVAHEIRNPLTTLKGFIQLAKSKNDIQPDYVEIMLSELERIDFIIGEFLVLAKPQVIHFEEKDIRELIQQTIPLIETQAILNDVQIVTNYEEELPLIYCGANQLKQVFINILKNSLEAMPKGGTILIQVKKSGDKGIRIHFCDQGSGIPYERLQKLGEPFYTTKEKGTGLGLMVSYKIIENHKGSISVHSELGKGTTFDIYLPVHPDIEASCSAEQ